MCGPVLGKIADPLNLSRGNGEALAKPWENPTKALDPLGIVAKDPVTRKTAQQSAGEDASSRYQYGQVVRPTQLNIPSPGEGAGASSSRNPGLQYLK